MQNKQRLPVVREAATKQFDHFLTTIRNHPNPEQGKLIRIACTKAILGIMIAKSIDEIIGIYERAQEELKTAGESLPELNTQSDPVSQFKDKLINDYNQARAELRTGGVYDESGCRVKFVEKELSAIYVRALGKVDKARSLPVLQRIQVDTANEVAAAMPFQKAA